MGLRGDVVGRRSLAQPTGTLVRYRIEAWAEHDRAEHVGDGDRRTRRRRAAGGRRRRERPDPRADSPPLWPVPRHGSFAYHVDDERGPRLAARRRHLPGLHRSLRDDGRRAVRGTRDARRLLRRHAARRHRASRSHRRAGRDVHLAVAAVPVARPITATTPPTLRTVEPRLGTRGRSPRARRRRRTRPGCGSSSTSPPTTSRRAIPRSSAALRGPGQPRGELVHVHRLARASTSRSSASPTIPRSTADDPGARDVHDRQRAGTGSSSVSTASGATTRRARRTRSGARSGPRPGEPAPDSDHDRRGRRDAGAPADVPRPDGRLPRLPPAPGAARAFFAFGDITRERASTRSCDAISPSSMATSSLPSFLDNHDMNRFLWIVARRCSPAAAGRALPVHAAASADRLLRHRGRPVPATRRPLRRRQRPPRGIAAADALGR